MFKQGMLNKKNKSINIQGFLVEQIGLVETFKLKALKITVTLNV